MARRPKKFGFSWRRASGLSAAKGRVARKLGVPLTRSGRRRKMRRSMGCSLLLAPLIGAIGCGVAWLLP